MAKAQIKDVYPQFMFLTVTMSAADTLTFGQVAIGASIFEYAGLIVNRIEYSFSRASWHELNAETDVMWGAICGSDSITDLDLDNPQVYDQIEVFPNISGTPANMIDEVQPVVHDFSSFEGGGLLLPAQDLYVGMSSSGFVAAGALSARVWYRVKALEAADYIELAQRLRVLST